MPDVPGNALGMGILEGNLGLKARCHPSAMPKLILEKDAYPSPPLTSFQRVYGGSDKQPINSEGVV